MKTHHLLIGIVITALAPGCLWNGVDARRQKAVYHVRGFGNADPWLKPRI